jgi:hypothetical protein
MDFLSVSCRRRGPVSKCGGVGDAAAACDTLPIQESRCEMSKPSDPVDEYRRQVAAWLFRREAKWRETAQTGIGLASDCASFYAAAYHNAAQGVMNGEPEKRAAIEKTSKDQ